MSVAIASYSELGRLRLSELSECCDSDVNSGFGIFQSMEGKDQIEGFDKNRVPTDL